MFGQEQVPIEFGTPMRYFANSTDPGFGSTWVQPSFDDSLWPIGAYGIGYETGTGAENLIQTTAPTDSISIYTRAEFTVADPSVIFNMRVGVDYDDGFIAWINGVEVARSASMPAGAVAWDTLCANHESSNGAMPFYEYTDISPAIPLLNVGVNTLAIGVWNSTLSSSDQVVVPRLTLNTPTNVTRGPYLQQGSHDRITVRWRTTLDTTSQVLCGTTQGALSVCGESFAATTEHEVELLGLTPDTRYYYAVGGTGQIFAGDDATHWFRTAAFPGTARPTRVWILGDSGTGDANATAVRDAYYGIQTDRAADVWLMLGDNAYPNGTDGQYQTALFDMYPDTLINSVLWPTLGNHDAATSNSTTLTGPYYDAFSLPDAAQGGGQASGTEAYYSFDRGNIHFIVLNSTDVSRSPTGAMATWLAADLAATAADWVIALWHHPPYSKGSHDSDTENPLIQMRTNILPILDDYGVDMTFTGHSHDYERTFLIEGHYGDSTTFVEGMKVDGGDGSLTGDGAYAKAVLGSDPHSGTVHTVAGSSGKISGGTLDHPAMVVSLNVLGSVVVDINANQADVMFLDDNGAVRDEYTMIKGGGLAPPVASFNALPIIGQAPLDVNFIDLSDNFPDTWGWDFDNNGVMDSQTPSPQHTYSPGVYSVSLTVSNMVGSDQAVQGDILCVHDGIPGQIQTNLVRGLNGDTFSWTGLPAAIDYDVARGELGMFRGAPAQVACIADDTQATSLLITEDPAGDEIYFYLVRAADCARQTGTFDSNDPGQTGSRDILFQGTAGACGCDAADDADGDIVCDAGFDDCIDSDFDGFGDPGVLDDLCADDNCPADFNPAQTNSDTDPHGDACDNCPTVNNLPQADFDSDGHGNACDNCIGVPNPNQADIDMDGVGNVCDNCKNAPNPDQIDSDGDGKGDACDPN